MLQAHQPDLISDSVQGLGKGCIMQTSQAKIHFKPKGPHLHMHATISFLPLGLLLCSGPLTAAGVTGKHGEVIIQGQSSVEVKS